MLFTAEHYLRPLVHMQMYSWICGYCIRTTRCSPLIPSQ